MKKGFTLITMIAILAFVTLMTGAVYAMCLIALKDTSRLQKDGFHSQMVSCVSSMSNSLRMYGSDWRPLTNSMQVPGDDENTYLTEFKLCDSSDWNINPQFYMSASLGKKRYDEYRDIFWTNKNIFDFNKLSTKETTLDFDYSRIEGLLSNQSNMNTYKHIMISYESPVVVFERHQDGSNWLWGCTYKNGQIDTTKITLNGNFDTKLEDNNRYLITINSNSPSYIIGSYLDSSNKQNFDIMLLPSNLYGLHIVSKSELNIMSPIISELTTKLNSKSQYIYDSIINKDTNITNKYYPLNYYNNIQNNYTSINGCPLIITVLNGDIILNQDLISNQMLSSGISWTIKIKQKNNIVDNRLNDFDSTNLGQQLLFDLQPVRGLVLQRTKLNVVISATNTQPHGDPLIGAVGWEYTTDGTTWVAYSPTDTTNSLTQSGYISIPNDALQIRCTCTMTFNSDINITSYLFALGEMQFPMQGIFICKNGALTVSQNSSNSFGLSVDIYGGLFDKKPNSRTVLNGNLIFGPECTLDPISKKCLNINGTKYLNIPEIPVNTTNIK